MIFFDGLINEVRGLLSPLNMSSYPYDCNKAFEDVGSLELVMQKDTAYELDGVGFNLITSKDIGESSINVIGKDLNEITLNTTFTRICIIELSQDIKDNQKAYDAIRKIEYAKYHYFPKGYMLRTSSSSRHENVRVSKDAIKNGISFEKVGDLLINKFMENKNVKNVKVYFLTDSNIDYRNLEKISNKNHEITETLNHVMNTINFDCDACNLKEICDEVEGMRELHFKNAGIEDTKV